LSTPAGGIARAKGNNSIINIPNAPSPVIYPTKYINNKPIVKTAARIFAIIAVIKSGPRVGDVHFLDLLYITKF
jgi:hypothetical protein